MTTIERPPLAVLSANTLKRAHTDFGKQSLPNLKSIIPRTSFPSLTNSLNSNGVCKPSHFQTHARKLKYRLKLAYYKLQTDQIGVPLTEIIKNHKAAMPVAPLPPLQKKKLTTTPSLTRHISLLAESTPLHGSSYAPILPKKMVTFKRSNSYVDPPTFSTASASVTTSTSSSTFTISNDQPLKKTKEEDQPVKKEKIKLPKISEYPIFKIDTKKIRLTSSSPNLDRSLTTHASHSSRIQDIIDSSATPIKSYRRENGEMLMSSPTKTPGSYGAAKSLLELSNH